MNGWHRCPKCGAGTVVERTSGCFGCLVGVFATIVIWGSSSLWLSERSS